MERVGQAARWWHPLADGRIQCDLCPRECRLRDGQRGFCFVRARQGDHLALTTHGRSSGFCIDPIEKKPLNHFHPGTAVLSFGTAGCNLGCKFCQNWDISTSREFDRLADQASARDIVTAAREMGCRSVAFTYNDPVIFAEYAIEVAEECQVQGIDAVAVSAGYINPEPRREFFAPMTAANIDLKAFDEDFYWRITGAHLQRVLDTLTYLLTETTCWTEITTLVIPGHNDSSDQLAELSRWVCTELGPDVPIHFSAFHPDHRMRDVPRTPPETLTRARDIARDVGLRYVYTGNVHDAAGDTTWCPGCDHPVIVRDWYQIIAYQLDSDARCGRCGAQVAGRFDDIPGNFGSRRIPIQIANQ